MTNHYTIRAVDSTDTVLREWEAGRSEADCWRMIMTMSDFRDIPIEAVGLRTYRNHEPINYFPIIKLGDNELVIDYPMVEGMNEYRINHN